MSGGRSLACSAKGRPRGWTRVSCSGGSPSVATRLRSRSSWPGMDRWSWASAGESWATGTRREDAFQATFLVLAKRAGSIPDPDRLGPWLHGVAHRVAVRARADLARRNARERPGAEGLA